MFDKRGVSRERIIGISFVDILIQAVFLLLLILMVGYVDPVQQLLYEKAVEDKPTINEFEGIGKDLCIKKFKKDSPIACREFIESRPIGPLPTDNFEQLGSDLCGRLGKSNPEECEKSINKLYGLIPCIASTDGVRVVPSATWEINYIDSAKFLGFTDIYIQYLKKEGDIERLEIVRLLENRRGSQMSPKEIESSFSFMKEKSCYHEVNAPRPVPFSNPQISELLTAIYGLKGLSAR